jgi:hypothetical protein
MSQCPAVPHALLEVEAGAVILANMLVGWLDENPRVAGNLESRSSLYISKK